MDIMNAANVSVSINGKNILQDVNLAVPEGSVLSIIGPNGSGKTTLLRVLCRSMKPQQGMAALKGKNIYRMGVREFAKEVAFLTQIHECPGDVQVPELVRYGRFAHKSWWKGGSGEDTEIVGWALERTGLVELAERSMGTLSGGERQRAWIAMALAQKPKVLILDEPTTYLDISHQLEVLKLIKSLNEEEGITVVMVLHDINQAVGYSEYVTVLKEGRVFASGRTEETVNSDIISKVFGVSAQVVHYTPEGKPVFHPE